MGDSSGGRLVLLGTPIGNLGDLTLRAIETLKACDRVAAEDTRRTRTLLTHLGIAKKSLTRLDAHASPRAVDDLLDHVAAGELVVFVTDAGMPGSSDPGSHLVRRAAERELALTVVPGPSAVTSAVALAGFGDTGHAFHGFLPRQGEKRHAALRRVVESALPVVLFEAANRTARTLQELAELAPERGAVVCRELTKLHEETVRGSLRELAAHEPDWRGEIAIVVAAQSDADATPGPSDEEIDRRIRAELARGQSAKDVASEVAAWSKLPRREVYGRVTRLRGGG